MITAEYRKGLTAWLAQALKERTADGAKQYGTAFYGRPLPQLAEEILDGLVYIYVLKKQLLHTPSADWQNMSAENRQKIAAWITQRVTEFADDSPPYLVNPIYQIEHHLIAALLAAYEVSRLYEEPL